MQGGVFFVGERGSTTSTSWEEPGRRKQETAGGRKRIGEKPVKTVEGGAVGIGVVQKP